MVGRDHAFTGDGGTSAPPAKKIQTGELKQLKKRFAKAKKELAKLQIFTSAANYASRVPVHVQEKDSQKLTALEDEIQRSEVVFSSLESSAAILEKNETTTSPTKEDGKIMGNLPLKTSPVCVPGVKRVYPKVERADDEKSGLYHAQNGDLKQLRRLIEHEGWSIQVVDKHGTNSLMWAAGFGHLHVCQYLGGMGKEQKRPVSDKLEIESRNKDGRTPLMWALRNGQLEVVKWLVSVGADVYSTNKSGTNMLQWAIWGGHIPAIQYVLENSTLDPKTRNFFGCTAAHWCVSRGDVELCQWFHQNGLPFSTVNKGGHSPLHKAAWHGQQNIVRWLVDDVRLAHTVHRRDEKGRSVIDLADMNGHHALAAWLLARWERQLRRTLIQREAARW
jgi:ankyrin repeat protein